MPERYDSVSSSTLIWRRRQQCFTSDRRPSYSLTLVCLQREHHVDSFECLAASLQIFDKKQRWHYVDSFECLAASLQIYDEKHAIRRSGHKKIWPMRKHLARAMLAITYVLTKLHQQAFSVTYAVILLSLSIQNNYQFEKRSHIIKKSGQPAMLV